MAGRTPVNVMALVIALALATAAAVATPSASAAEDGAAHTVPGGLIAKAHAPFPGVLPDRSIYIERLRDASEINAAGAHPDASVSFTVEPLAGHPPGWGNRVLKEIIVDTPPGFIGNPQAVATCPMEQFTAGIFGRCSNLSQVGVTLASVASTVAPVYNLPAPADAPALFGFRTVGGDVILLKPTVRSDGDYGLRVVVSDLQVNLREAVTTIWGIPYDPVHNAQRACPGLNFVSQRCQALGQGDSAPGGSAIVRPFLINPTHCGAGPLPTVLSLQTWLDPSIRTSETVFTGQETGGCEKLEFGRQGSPVSLEVKPDSRRAGAPTGAMAKLRLPYSEDPEALAYPTMRDTVVELPEGLTINPSSADGLEACTEKQLGWQSLDIPRCPEGSQIATAEVITPLLTEPLRGGVYVAEQDRNPLGAFMALYLAIKSSTSSVQAKVVGAVDRDPVTGRLTATFKDNPQLPFTELNLRFKSGARAPLALPLGCGSYETVATLAPWSAPQSGPPAVWKSAFSVAEGPDGGPCQSLGFAPSFNAGTVRSVASSSSPFSLAVARENATRELRSIKSIRLPEGLLGNVSSVPLCGEAQAAAGTCPEESRVGHVQVAAGAGALPLWVPQAGKEPTGVYLTGPYNGAPYGLSIKVPAQAGPFDLGRVVVRSALHVDERTAAITSGVDETRLIDPDGTVTEVLPGDLPRILKGVVLNQREIRVLVDREDFMVNPTDCSQQRISAEVLAYGGGKVDVGNRFRAVECANLGFKPRFNARILDRGRRSTLRSWHPRTRFTVVPRKGDANIGGARVALPSSTILDQSNIGTTCTRAQMAARDCPAKSLVGYAKAWSPLLRKAVEGPVYLAANGGVRPLPDLAAVLDGEIRVVLQGEVSTLRTGGKARLQNTFRVVPDAPVSRFVLTMRGGKNTGLLVNSTDLCRTNERGVAAFQGQNGRSHRMNLRIGLSFKGCAKARRQVAKRMAVRKAALRKAARKVG